MARRKKKSPKPPNLKGWGFSWISERTVLDPTVAKVLFSMPWGYCEIDSFKVPFYLDAETPEVKAVRATGTPEEVVAGVESLIADLTEKKLVYGKPSGDHVTIYGNREAETWSRRK